MKRLILANPSLLHIIHAAKQGNPPARETLLLHLKSRTESHIIYLLGRYGFEYLINSHLNDIINQVCEDLLLGLSKFELHPDASTIPEKAQNAFYAWCSVRRECRVVDYLQKETRHHPPAITGYSANSPPSSEAPPLNGASSKNIDDEVLTSEIWEFIENSFGSRDRDVMKFLYKEGRNYKEISKMLKLNINSIGSINTRCIRKIKKFVHK